MSANDGPRDWDKELAEIDKLLEKGGGDAPPPVSQRPGKPQKAVAGGGGGGGGGGGAAPVRQAPAGPPIGRRDAMFTWLRLGLGITLGVGMLQWPYTHGCGLPLYGYLAGVLVVIIAAIWTIVSSWRTRSAVAHFLSIALLGWGATLAAREVLPRVGYAQSTAEWQCTDAPAAAPAAAPQAAPQGPAAAPVTAPATDSVAPAAADSAKAQSPARGT